MDTGGHKHLETIEFAKDELPRLNTDEVDWNSASDPTEDYNCFGMAVGVLKWWQPPNDPELTRNPRDHWPDGLPDKDHKISTFIAAAESLGFFCCNNPIWSKESDVIVLFYDIDDNFSHASIQIAPNIWKSKLGPFSDIEHTLESLEESSYGASRQFMMRQREKRAL